MTRRKDRRRVVKGVGEDGLSLLTFIRTCLSGSSLIRSAPNFESASKYFGLRTRTSCSHGNSGKVEPVPDSALFFCGRLPRRYCGQFVSPAEINELIIESGVAETMTASAAIAALYLSLKWRDKSNLTSVGRSDADDKKRFGIPRATVTRGHMAEVPISQESPLPSALKMY